MLDIEAGRISGVMTEQGLICCSAVLVAGGAWSGMPLRHHNIRFLQASVNPAATALASALLPVVSRPILFGAM